MVTDLLTNTVYFSSLLPEKCPILTSSIETALQSHGIPYAYLLGTKDIWCRDFMPVQIENDRFVSYLYTPNYLQDRTGLRLQTDPEEVLQSDYNSLQQIASQCVRTDLVMDGGNVVKWGHTVVMTEKVFKENKDKSREEVERILRDAFRCEILFLPWDRKESYGHSDGVVHYAGDGRVILTNYGDFSPSYYKRFREILDSHFEVIPLKYQVKRKHAHSWAYINYLQVGKLVFVPQFGLEEDEQALEQIGCALPGHEVIGIPAVEAVRRGGALNCISWNILTVAPPGR